MPEPLTPATGTPPPADEARTTDGADGGWTVESNSYPTDPPPLDTTAARPAAAPIARDSEEDGGEAEEGEPEAAAPPSSTHEEHAGADAVAAQAARDASTGRFTKPKKKQSVQERINAMRREVGDRDRELASERSQREELQRRIEALEKGGKPAEPAAKTPEAPAPPPVAARPKAPKYSDFETDEDYQAALGKYDTDLDAWQTAREERLKTEITTGLDQRLETQKQEDARLAHEGQVAERMAKMKLAHPDFTEKLTANAEVMKEIKTPFLNDMIQHHGDGAELFYDLASDPELALSLAELPLPSRPLADAVRRSPAMRTLMKHFATDDGRTDFLRLRALHPVDCLLEVGKMTALLESADRGPAPGVVHPITNAAPPAKPPVGTLRARAPQAPGVLPPLEDWMADEDKRERNEKLRAAGHPVPA